MSRVQIMGQHPVDYCLQLTCQDASGPVRGIGTQEVMEAIAAGNAFGRKVRPTEA